MDASLQKNDVYPDKKAYRGSSFKVSGAGVHDQGLQPFGPCVSAVEVG
jgi:hypothetical protein